MGPRCGAVTARGLVGGGERRGGESPGLQGAQRTKAGDTAPKPKALPRSDGVRRRDRSYRGLMAAEAGRGLAVSAPTVTNESTKKRKNENVFARKQDFWRRSTRSMVGSKAGLVHGEVEPAWSECGISVAMVAL